MVKAHPSALPFLRPCRPSAELRLGHRSLYIIPSRFGVLWTASACLLLLVAIQTSSNSTLLLGFLMLGLMLLAMFLTHDTLQGLTLRCDQPIPNFAGEPAHYPIRLEGAQRRPPMRLRLKGQAALDCSTIAEGVSTVALPWTPHRRGWQLPPPVHIETIAPLGLFICWGRWQPQQPHLIWPRCLPGPVAELQPPQAQDGLDEWTDMRPVREGERPAVVDWASVARGRPMQAKVFGQPLATEVLLAPADGVPLEKAREHLADRVRHLHHRGIPYGLRFGGVTLGPDRGLPHRDRCLEVLATA